MSVAWLSKLQTVDQKQLAELPDAEDEFAVIDFLLGNRLASKDQILQARSHHYRVPSLRLDGYSPSLEAVALLNEEQARKLQAVPLFILDGKLYAAMRDPTDLRCEDFLRKLTGMRVKPVLSFLDEINNIITRKYLTARQDPGIISGGKTMKAPSRRASLARRTRSLAEGQSPVVKAVWKLIRQGIRLEASDIHLEPGKEQVSLRYRIDGVLHAYDAPSIAEYPAIVSRIKVVSQLDIAERRLPQDGRIAVELEGQEFDLRVSILPGVFGEGICIRILDPKAANRTLEEMGFEGNVLKRYDKTIRQPHGIVLVVGPTGSGKSTTLYATLSRISSREKKIITVEDPVEYKLAGLQQIAIRPEIGYTFGVGLRAILRHDPDVIMLGEIRDLESAQIAFRAALTGHLLFSTLHTNSAALAVSRLVEMGLPAYQVLTGLSGVLSQRLIRVLCQYCKQPADLKPEVSEKFNLKASGKQLVYEPKGCSHCNNLGYKGRTGIHEFLPISDEMRRLASNEVNASILERLAREDGFKPLRETAAAKLIDGVTSVSEVLAVTQD